MNKKISLLFVILSAISIIGYILFDFPLLLLLFFPPLLFRNKTEKPRCKYCSYLLLDNWKYCPQCSNSTDT